MIASRSVDELEVTARTIREFGGEVDTYVGDLGKKEFAEGLMQAAIARFGTPTIVINNAGILHITPFEEVTLEEWDRVMEINLRSVFILSQLLWRIRRQLNITL